MRELGGGFGDDLVIIGVHSGKFRAERDTGNIAQAVRRHEIAHAVANDRQYRVWRAYGVGAWPTIALIDARGRYVGTYPGEVTADELAPQIAELIKEAGNDLDRSPLPLRLPAEADTRLRFPTKVLAVSRERLFVADSGHNRVLELAVTLLDPPRARVVRTVGSGERGLTDGLLAEARFDHPHGMSLHGETLYIADTENHVVRAVDLSGGTVTTLAGTGEQARRFNQPGKGGNVALNSPWDIAALEGALVVAMAGSHQLWAIDLSTTDAEPLVGTGREDLSDGPALRCTLAQPTGLHVSDERIYFADSESSAVREADYAKEDWDVRTIVGQGLFDFGDEDGKGGRVRLQHPYGVTEEDGMLYVADTYNNKIKRLDPATGECVTFLGSGEEGLVDGAAEAARFDEPQGVSIADGLLVIADTNNHALRVADVDADKLTVSTLHIVE